MMIRSIVWRIVLVVIVILLAIWKIYPPEEKINRGLDLQGGMHLVLGVKLDEVLLLNIKEDELREKTAEELKDLSRRMGIDAEDKSKEQLIEEIIKEQKRQRRLIVATALQTIQNRVDEFGVAEPQIQRQGKDQIVVQLPGVVDTERALEVVSKVAHLEFKLVEADPKTDPDKIKRAEEGNIPPGYELKYLVGKTGSKRKWEPLLLRKDAPLTGSHLTNAFASYDQLGRPEVRLKFDRVGARIFSRLTGEHVGRRLAIVLDGKVQSAPQIREKIPRGEAVITGDFTMAEVSVLSSILRAGSLPAPVEVLSMIRVGPALGEDSIRQGIRAALVGGILVVLFMVIYYALSGLVANCALFLCLFLVLGALAGFKATLTLPGIAGLVLTIGMSVDANVLIFERIREELLKKKTVRAAVDSGYHKALLTITDANVTTLIAAMVLFYFGTGPVKGFAVVLSIGVLASMFTALVVTKLVFDYFIYIRKIDKLSI